jgi:hypothetical protein
MEVPPVAVPEMEIVPMAGAVAPLHVIVVASMVTGRWPREHKVDMTSDGRSLAGELKGTRLTFVAVGWVRVTNRERSAKKLRVVFV